MKERFFEVLPSSRGEVVGWWAFRKGRFKSPDWFGRCFGVTTALTDAVTTMWKLCQEIDPKSQRFVIVPNGFTSSYFRIEFRSQQFLVEAERRLARGAFPLNPLAAEFGGNYEVIFHLVSEDDAVLQQLGDLFRENSPGAKILREAWL